MKIHILYSLINLKDQANLSSRNNLYLIKYVSNKKKNFKSGGFSPPPDLSTQISGGGGGRNPPTFVPLHKSIDLTVLAKCRHL